MPRHWVLAPDSQNEVPVVGVADGSGCRIQVRHPQASREIFEAHPIGSAADHDFGVLASPHATLEELYLAGRLGPADFRLRHSDFSADGAREGIPWLGMPIAELGAGDLFGEMTCMSFHPRSATVRAKMPI